MLTGVEDDYNLEVTSRFPRTNLPLFTSCAAVMWNYLLLVLSGSLAATASTGRRGRPRLVLMARLLLALTTSTLMLLVCTRRMARTSAGSVSPSAALVLY